MVHLFRFKTHIQNPINNTFTYSYTFQSLKRLFILVFISSRISTLVRFAFSELLSSYAPDWSLPLSFTRCATYRLLLTRLLFRVSLFFLPFLRFRTKLPAISQRYTRPRHSLLPSGFFFSSRRNFSLESHSSFGGSFCSNLFLFLPLSPSLSLFSAFWYLWQQ